MKAPVSSMNQEIGLQTEPVPSHTAGKPPNSLQYGVHVESAENSAHHTTMHRI